MRTARTTERILQGDLDDPERAALDEADGAVPLGNQPTDPSVDQDLRCRLLHGEAVQALPSRRGPDHRETAFGNLADVDDVGWLREHGPGAWHHPLGAELDMECGYDQNSCRWLRPRRLRR
jgi:hypothetical protein